MRLISWNINSLRKRLEQLRQLLQEYNPDVVLLQETKVQDLEFPQDFFHQQGYNVCFWGQKSYNGVAVASRHALQEVRQKNFTQEGTPGEARYLEARTGGLRVASVYVPNGQSLASPAYEKKRQFFTQLRSHAAPYLAMPELTLLGGDFNVALEEADVAHPQNWQGRILFSAAERQWLQGLQEDGWIDCIPTRSDPSQEAGGQDDPPKKNPFTWWDYRTRAWQRQGGLRIDYFFASPQAYGKILRSQVLTSWRGLDGPSDHAPLGVDLGVGS